MSKSPFPYSSLEPQNGEILSQEVITYVKREGSIIRINVRREFDDGDYTDSMSTEVIYSGYRDV